MEKNVNTPTDSTQPTPEAPAPLDTETATARWVEKLGLEPGTKPVSMTGVKRYQREDGSWALGG